MNPWPAESLTPIHEKDSIVLLPTQEALSSSLCYFVSNELWGAGKLVVKEEVALPAPMLEVHEFDTQLCPVIPISC